MESYSAIENFEHGQEVATGILLTNLGTPDAPTKQALRTYLKEFLWDPRVVEQPRWLWWLILNGIILNTRPARSAALYAKVWSSEGSPLLATGIRQRDKLATSLEEKFSEPVHVELAMRYGNPSIQHGLETLRNKNCTRIIVLPLYPQYSATTSGSTLDAVTNVLKTWRRVPQLHFIDSYHDHPAYIDALAESIRTHWQEHGRAERLLLSYHGIPESYFKKGDPYPCQCRKTTRLVREALGLDSEQLQFAFQSRFGKEPWVQPYTDETLEKWGKEGLESVDVICPGFAADCLETIEEIGMENREIFLEAGGKGYRYITALNDQESHIKALTEVILQQR